MAEHVVELTEESFKAEVLEATVPVVVDFWAPWCGPCRTMAPVLEKYAEQKSGQVKVTKVNVDEHGGVAGQYGIMSIPTFMVFSGGKPVGQIVGAMPGEAFAAKVEAALASAK